MAMLEMDTKNRETPPVPCVPCTVSDYSLATLAALFLVACVGTVALDAMFTIAPPPIHGLTSPVP
jgi:hypothetical protein